MEQDERRIWLIRQLQKEMPEYAGIPLPEDPEGQWQLFRGLCNFFWKPAPPKPEPVMPDTPGHATIKYYRMQKGIGLRKLVSKMNGVPNRHALRDYERGRSEPDYQEIGELI